MIRFARMCTILTSMALVVYCVVTFETTSTTNVALTLFLAGVLVSIGLEANDQ